MDYRCSLARFLTSIEEPVLSPDETETSVKLSVVVPAYNERDNLSGDHLVSFRTFLQQTPWPVEILFVDDGSTDGTAERLKAFADGQPGCRFVPRPHRGKLSAVRGGVNEARGRYVLYSDFDLSAPLDEVHKLLPYLENDYDIAVGSREAPGSRRLDEPWYRHVMGRCFNWLVQLLVLPGIDDTQCGFKLFRREVALELFRALVVCRPRQREQPFTGAFDTELLVVARVRGYRIAEVPVYWKHASGSHVRPWSDSREMLGQVVRIALHRWLYRSYDPP